MARIGRREFIGGAVGLGTGVLIGCEGVAALLDGGLLDSGRDGGPAALPRGLSKPPYVQLLGSGSARLRFETRIDESFEVAIRIDGAGATVHVPRRESVLLEYERDAIMRGSLPDVPGVHVLHEIVLEDLPPGADVGWTVTPPDAEAVTGRFRAAIGPGAPFRVGWLADTMLPVAEESAILLAGQSPDLVIHGGDITYHANPFDTWSSMMAAFAPLSAAAPLHFAVGNHEFEAMNEIDVQYDRLFAGQGAAAPATRYFAFTYGHVRFITLDTESGGFPDPLAPQVAWLDAELARVDTDPDLRFAIVGFHRPTYTLSRHAPREILVRELLHERFRAHRVPLVLSGHVHAYERFVVDDVTYWIDGGAGAVLYDPDQRRADVESWRPGESDLRLSASHSHGVTVMDVDVDGISLRRLATEDGAVQDEVRITA